MAKFNLSTDKQLFVRGGLVTLSAGAVDTDDQDLINALKGAKDVAEVEQAKQPRTKKQAALD